MTNLRRVSLIVFGLMLQPADAALITSGFAAHIDSGPLADTAFTGTFSYDTAGETGVGTEYLTLASLHFILKGIAFDKADIRQGGQVILDNGVYQTFTAAFFPPPPLHSPTADIAFGFGGPGIIGYFVGTESGLGTFAPIPQSDTPEPGTLGVLAFGLLALGARVTSGAKKSLR